jgi:O-antigen ligase
MTEYSDNPLMIRIRKSKIPGRLNDLLLVLFLFSFVFSIRFFVGLFTILLAANALLAYRLESGKWWNPAFFNLFTVGIYLFFAMQAIALLYTGNRREGVSIFQTNLGMIVLPVGVLYGNLVNRQSYGRVMKAGVHILFAATVLSLAWATVSFFQYRDPGVFFYHPLVRLYSDHASEFSVIVFFGILFLVDEYSSLLFLQNRSWIAFLLIYFSGFLFLLSSKLVIIIYFLYILYVFAFTDALVKRRTYRFTGLFLITALMASLLLAHTPFSRRLKDETDASLSLIRQQKFTPGDYFTGVQFRLLSWRFVYEVLNEKHAWILGLSPGDSQDALVEKYKRENLFTGGTPGNKTGYLGYHSHNQFLQAVLETGIFGLAFFILACAGLIRMAGKSGSRSLRVFVLLLLCFCFTDAPLKTQYGIVLFVFFPLFMYRGSQSAIPAG